MNEIIALIIFIFILYLLALGAYKAFLCNPVFSLVLAVVLLPVFLLWAFYLGTKEFISRRKEHNDL